MIRHVQETLELDMKLRVGLVSSGGPEKSPAWIDLPMNMPPYGMATFKEMRLTMHVRKSFLHERPFEMVVVGIAHELSHVVLSGTHHPLRREEEAVDLTAMALGYRDFFRRGCEYATVSQVTKQRSFLRSLFALRTPSALSETISTTHRIGYLTAEEVAFAAKIMDRQR